MKFNVDTKYLLDCFRDIINVPSPTGYYRELNPVLERYAEDLGYTVTYDNRKNAYITLDGEDNTKTVMLSAHADTVGLMVRRIDGCGTLRIRSLGGINLSTLDGETVTVHTRDGRAYTGLFLCQSYSTHVFKDALSLERNESTMMILLDEDVHTKAAVEALGIGIGDFVSVDPRCQITANGFVKSRFIDDKGAIACSYAMLKYMKENGLKPKYRTILTFPYFEELGFDAYVPEGVSEYVSVDIGMIGPDNNATEHSVSICAKDGQAVYDYDLTNRLVEYAKKADINYTLELYYRYSSDSNVVRKAGYDLSAALFGMPVYGSHGMERTHVDALANTTALMLAYVLDI